MRGGGALVRDGRRVLCEGERGLLGRGRRREDGEEAADEGERRVHGSRVSDGRESERGSERARGRGRVHRASIGERAAAAMRSSGPPNLPPFKIREAAASCV